MIYNAITRQRVNIVTRKQFAINYELCFISLQTNTITQQYYIGDSTMCASCINIRIAV